MPDLILSKGSCCECKYNKCNREREDSPLSGVLFFLALYGAVYLFGRYVLPKLEKGSGYVH